MQDKNGSNKATFVVQVQFCENSSWQGTLSWTDQRKEQHFRSALELVKLMDEALDKNKKDNPAMWE